MSKANLSEQETTLLTSIRNHYAMTGFCLSLADGAEVLGISRGGKIAGMFKRLEEAGEIEYSHNRSHYVPKDWRELAAGGLPMPEPYKPTDEEIAELIKNMNKGGIITVPDPSDMPEFKALQEENERLRKQLKAAKSKAYTNAELERIKEQNRKRQANFKKRKKEARNRNIV